ncbi:MAG: Uma2 family endonuclease [Acidobacteriaceae bacterium]|nr:Uma2 family endonuclease [Acidobacteriaceae bacterium]
MAVAFIPPLTSVDEYLKTSYRPDMEFVDGVLVERGMPTIPHSRLQAILIRYFAQFEHSLGFLALPEVRTQIAHRARYRVPDLMLCPTPVPQGRIVTTVPWVVIEIMSPDDRLPEQLERFRDYRGVGVTQIILLDPEKLIAFRFHEESLLRQDLNGLDLPTGQVPFDTNVIFDQLRKDLLACT